MLWLEFWRDSRKKIYIGMKPSLQLSLLIVFLVYFGLPAIQRFREKKAMVISFRRDTGGREAPAPVRLHLLVAVPAAVSVGLPLSSPGGLHGTIWPVPVFPPTRSRGPLVMTPLVLSLRWVLR